MFYINQQHTYEYLQALENVARQFVWKKVLSNSIINSVYPSNRRQVSYLCDIAFYYLDIINPPRTQEFKALSFITNNYNLSQHYNYLSPNFYIPYLP